MSFAGPNAFRSGVRPSRVLTEEEDVEVRESVFDCGLDFNLDDGKPQIIIGNRHTGCRADYYPRRGNTPPRFVFFHGFNMFSTMCGCITKGDPKTITHDVPPELLEHGIMLVTERGLETKIASIIMMKLFLGLYIPESLRGSFLEG
jgi:hypothetical protein